MFSLSPILFLFIENMFVYLQRVQSVNTAPKLQKRLELTMRNIKRRKIEGYETVLF